jgi:hypothetical protein
MSGKIFAAIQSIQHLLCVLEQDLLPEIFALFSLLPPWLAIKTNKWWRIATTR